MSFIVFLGKTASATQGQQAGNWRSFQDPVSTVIQTDRQTEFITANSIQSTKMKFPQSCLTTPQAVEVAMTARFRVPLACYISQVALLVHLGYDRSSAENFRDENMHKTLSWQVRVSWKVSLRSEKIHGLRNACG